MKCWISPVTLCEIVGDEGIGRLVRGVAAFVNMHHRNAANGTAGAAGSTPCSESGKSATLLVYALECVYTRQRWSVLVWLGQQLQALWDSGSNEVHTIALRTIYRRTEHAQQAIVDIASSELERHQVALTELTASWEAYLATKKGPKVT